MLFSVIFILLRKKSRTTFTGNSTLKNQKYDLQPKIFDTN